MSEKTIGIILFFMLVIPNIIVSAERLSINEPSNEQIIIKKTSTEQDDDAPDWSVGDSWTFSITNFWSESTFEGKTIKMNGKIDDFKWTVTDNSSSYIVDLTGEIIANYEIILPTGSSELNIKGTFGPPLNKLEGTIIFDKANLHIVDFDGKLTCLTSVKIGNFPMKIPMIFSISTDTSFSTPFPLLNFPLHAFKFWNMPEMDIDVDISIKGILGIAEIPITAHAHYDWIPLAFSCLSQTSIEVDAGTFDAWKIQSLLGGFFEYYYAPSAENIVKFEFSLPHGGIEGELKDYELYMSQRSLNTLYFSRARAYPRINLQ